jgi:hypothetical protein
MVSVNLVIDCSSWGNHASISITLHYTIRNKSDHINMPSGNTISSDVTKKLLDDIDWKYDNHSSKHINFYGEVDERTLNLLSFLSEYNVSRKEIKKYEDKPIDELKNELEVLQIANEMREEKKR